MVQGACLCGAVRLQIDGDIEDTSYPDLICLLDVESLEPVSAERVRYGQRVAVLAIGAPRILTSERALAVVGPRGFGFDYDFVPVTAG